MRRFIEPGDQLITEAKNTEFSDEKSLFKTLGTVNSKRAATITIEFEHLTVENYKKAYLS